MTNVISGHKWFSYLWHVSATNSGLTVTMTTRIGDIIRKLESNKAEVLRQALNQIDQIENFSHEEKIDLSDALASLFYLFQNSGSITMLKLAIQTERQLAGFGTDVVPFLFHEITELDGESAAYLGTALAKIGKPGLDYMLHEWEHYRGDEHAQINLIQTLSYFKLSEVKEAIPLLISASRHENYHLSSMALYAIGRLVERSKGIKVDPQLTSILFELAVGFVSGRQALVRKNAVRILGQMVRRNLLSAPDQKKVHSIFLEITGKDARHHWDSAFIVRQEAEHFMKYFSCSQPGAQAYNQSFRILTKTYLCTNTFHFTIEAPFIARKIEAGQFIIVRPYSMSERIPLSVCGWDRIKGTLQIIVSAVGKTSTEINRMQKGDTFKDVVGPLGERSRLPETVGTCVVIGGGYGTGAIIPTAKDLKARGNKVIGIVGARNKEGLIMIDELKTVCDEVMITTNDDSCGRAGMVTDALKDILSTENITHVLAVGPVPMMRAVSEMTRPLKIETFVSLNAIMVDGTGMCGACRVSVGNETKFACFHGPDFDGHLVDFENLMKRQKMFVKEEKIALARLNTLKHEECDY
ncbi:MAG: sulfide/dihydroorotate dehydrogenase-like FAD/NAD-binding protein [Cyclobacteriaceae bacterium]